MRFLFDSFSKLDTVFIFWFFRIFFSIVVFILLFFISFQSNGIQEYKIRYERKKKNGERKRDVEKKMNAHSLNEWEKKRKREIVCIATTTKNLQKRESGTQLNKIPFYYYCIKTQSTVWPFIVIFNSKTVSVCADTERHRIETCLDKMDAVKG